MAEPCAIIGIGQTKHAARREDVSQAGLVREAAKRALQDADMIWKDIDAIVIGKAPDLIEGVVMPELFLADALGGYSKPVMHVHTAGSVGGSTGIVASHLIQSGQFERVLAVAFEKQSESNAMWALSQHHPLQPPVASGAGGYFAPMMRAYIKRSGAPDHIGACVAVKDRLNGLKNPYAHLHMPDINLEQVQASPLLWEPIRYLETCPSSDGAAAMVLADKSTAAKSPRKPAWILGSAVRSEPMVFCGRDQVTPRAGRDCAQAAYQQAGITNPSKEIDMAEIYVPFSWYEPMWLENLGFAEDGAGWQYVDEGITALDGALPVNASGGVLCSNPIGASGLLRFAEAALQVRGCADEHQIDGVRRALGHAFGGGAQFFAVWIVGENMP